MLKKVALAVAAAFVAQAASASSIDFHGYMRAEVGTTSRGGNLQCFRLGYPAQAKFRLGNECDNYMESAFDTKLYKGADGVWSNYHLRLALREKGSQDFEGDTTTSTGNFQIASRENYVDAGGFFGSAGPLKNAKIWLGKRFYNRNDVHIDDYYYWANTGQGAGIEGIEFGPVKFAYAYIQNGGNSSLDGASGSPTFNNASGSTAAVKKHEIRFYDIPVNPNGKLEVAAQLIHGSTVGNSGADHVGFLWTVQHQQSNLLGGFNKIALQYGLGNGAGGNWIPAYASGGNGIAQRDYRIVEQFMFAPTGTHLSGMVTANIDKNQSNNDLANPSWRTWWAIGARPVYNFTDNFSLAVEVSHEDAVILDSGNNFDGKDQKLNKLTIAPQLAAGAGFWARPVFRLFYTYAQWNDAAAHSSWGNVEGNENNVFTSALGSGSHGATWGAQVEAWW